MTRHVIHRRHASDGADCRCISRDVCSLTAIHHSQKSLDDPHHCRLCGQAYPVPSLARDCEAKHLRETTTSDTINGPNNETAQAVREHC